MALIRRLSKMGRAPSPYLMVAPFETQTLSPSMTIVTLASFVFCTGLVGFITWLITRRDDHESSQGYFLAGRSLSGVFVAGSLMLTNLSTEQLVGLNGLAFTDGISVMAWEVVAAVSLVVLALFFLPRYLKSGIATVPQFLEERYDDGTRTITSLIFLFAYAAILLPIILYTGAVGLTDILDIQGLTGIDSRATILWGAVWLIGIIGSTYAIFGGLRTVAISDTLNGVGLLIGGVLISYFGLRAINQANPLEGFQTLRESYPDKFNSLGRDDQSVPFSTLFSGVLLINLFYWTTNQQIIQRAFAAKSLKEGQKGVLYAGVLKVLAPLILVLPGLVAFHLYGTVELNGERLAIEEVTNGPMTVIATDVERGDTLLQGQSAFTLMETQSLETAQDKIGQDLEYVKESGESRTVRVEAVVSAGTILARDGNGQQRIVSGQQADSFIAPSRRDRAYGRLVRDVLPPWLAGFFAAVIVGAILSSFNSVLNSSATLFSLGIYQHVLHPTASDQQIIRAGKIFGGLVAIAAMSVAPLLAGQDGIFKYLQKMNGLYFIPIFAVMVVGLTTRRVPAIAAKVGLIAGFAVIAMGYWWPPLARWVSQINEFHFLGIVFLALVSGMLMIGFARPRSTQFVQRDSGEVDLTPWRFAWPIGAALVLWVIAIYVYFADTSAL